MKNVKYITWGYNTNHWNKGISVWFDGDLGVCPIQCWFNSDSEMDEVLELIDSWEEVNETELKKYIGKFRKGEYTTISKNALINKIIKG